MSSSRNPKNVPDRNGDWLEYWLAETKAVDVGQTAPHDEPLTVGLLPPPPKTVTVPPEDLTPPPRLSGYQVCVPPKGLMNRNRPIRHGFDIPEDFVRVDPYTQPPDADVIDPDSESVSPEAGVMTLPPEEP